MNIDVDMLIDSVDAELLIKYLEEWKLKPFEQDYLLDALFSDAWKRCTGRKRDFSETSCVLSAFYVEIGAQMDHLATQC